jgi:hypothetical protein
MLLKIIFNAASWECIKASNPFFPDQCFAEFHMPRWNAISRLVNSLIMSADPGCIGIEQKVGSISREKRLYSIG